MSGPKSILSFVKSHNVKLTGLFIFVWVLDRFSKIEATHLTGVAILNNGLILGSFSELPAQIKVTLFSMVGICAFALYLLMLYIIDHRAYHSRGALTVIFAGIMGNVFDRVAYGGVIDFISISLFGGPSPPFNIADVSQWVGYAVLIWGAWQDRHYLRYATTRRSQLFILPRFQKRLCAIFVLLSLLFNMLCSVCSFIFLKMALSLGQSSAATEKLMPAFVVCLVATTILSSSLMMVFGLRLSHRIAGPLFAFERHMREFFQTKGEPKRFKLRSGDELQELEEIANGLKDEYLKSKH